MKKLRMSGSALLIKQIANRKISNGELKMIKDEIREHLEVVGALNDELLAHLEEAIEWSVASLKKGGKLLFCGNGGSAADAQHLAAEFVVRFQKERAALAAIALTTDASALTAAGNDYAFEEVFSRQVEALGREGDILFAISTSGTSANVVRAAEAARSKGVQVVSITGAKESPLGKLADIKLRMPSTKTSRIQECYFLLGHILCGQIEDRLFEE